MVESLQEVGASKIYSLLPPYIPGIRSTSSKILYRQNLEVSEKNSVKRGEREPKKVPTCQIERGTKIKKRGRVVDLRSSLM